ncbi:peptidase MA family metallohydrolase [Ferruginibacter sp.]
MNKQTKYLVISVAAMLVLSSWDMDSDNWLTEKNRNYQYHYTAADKNNTKTYNQFIITGIREVKTFFGAAFKNTFAVYVHPNRHSIDSTWQHDWKMPEFKSECWMVASGVSNRLDIISPITWDKEACEHRYSETNKTQQVITHELVHVFHGQINASPDFSDVTNIDWFVEGLATYASGQCDAARIAEVQKAITANTVPATLDLFWTGKLKYGISGSVVKYIDVKYGRNKLLQLLPFNKKKDILAALGITENELLNNWKTYISSL